MKIVKFLEESGLLIKIVYKTIKNEAKEQRYVFLSILLDTLGASLLGNPLTGKWVKAKIPRPELIRVLNTDSSVNWFCKTKISKWN